MDNVAEGFPALYGCTLILFSVRGSGSPDMINETCGNARAAEATTGITGKNYRKEAILAVMMPAGRSGGGNAGRSTDTRGNMRYGSYHPSGHYSEIAMAHHFDGPPATIGTTCDKIPRTGISLR